MSSATTLRGSCHCGRLAVAFSTALEPPTLAPRACDCKFCRKHGAAWVSDPAGRLAITGDADALHAYRQGSHTARFVLCHDCGVLLAVVFEHEGQTCGAVNAGSLDGECGLGEAVVVSPQQLGAAEKVARWQQLWVRDVTLPVSST